MRARNMACADWKGSMLVLCLVILAWAAAARGQLRSHLVRDFGSASEERGLRRSLVADSTGWSYEKSAVLCGGFRTDGSTIDESALSGTVQPFIRNGAILSMDVDSEEVNVKHYLPQTGPSASSFRPYEFQAVYGLSVFRGGSPESRGVVADGIPAEGRVKCAHLREHVSDAVNIQVCCTPFGFVGSLTVTLKDGSRKRLGSRHCTRADGVSLAPQPDAVLAVVRHLMATQPQPRAVFQPDGSIVRIAAEDGTGSQLAAVQFVWAVPVQAPTPPPAPLAPPAPFTEAPTPSITDTFTTDAYGIVSDVAGGMNLTTVLTIDVPYTIATVVLGKQSFSLVTTPTHDASIVFATRYGKGYIAGVAAEQLVTRCCVPLSMGGGGGIRPEPTAAAVGAAGGGRQLLAAAAQSASVGAGARAGLGDAAGGGAVSQQVRRLPGDSEEEINDDPGDVEPTYSNTDMLMLQLALWASECGISAGGVRVRVSTSRFLPFAKWLVKVRPDVFLPIEAYGVRSYVLRLSAFLSSSPRPPVDLYIVDVYDTQYTDLAMRSALLRYVAVGGRGLFVAGPDLSLTDSPTPSSSAGGTAPDRDEEAQDALNLRGRRRLMQPSTYEFGFPINEVTGWAGVYYFPNPQPAPGTLVVGPDVSLNADLAAQIYISYLRNQVIIEPTSLQFVIMPIATARQNYQLYGNGGPSALNFFSYLDTINQLGGYIPDITISSPPPPSPTRARPPTPPPFSTTFARNIGCFADSALSPILSVRLTLSPRRDMRLGVCKTLADDWEARGNPTLVYIGLQGGHCFGGYTFSAAPPEGYSCTTLCPGAAQQRCGYNLGPLATTVYNLVLPLQ